MDKAIGFELFADMAFFRRGYTTTSTLTYSFPPKTVLAGLMAGILGKRDGYRESFNASRIAVVITSPLRKLLLKQNMLYIKGEEIKSYNNSERRLQVPIQYILHPRYRVYFHADRDLYGQLKLMLENRNSLYTPYLGVANCIANITYLGEFTVSEKKVNETPAMIDSIIPLDVVPLTSIDFFTANVELRVVRERVPVSMDDSRVVSRYSDMIFLEPGPGGNGNDHSPRLVMTSGSYWEVMSSSGVKENVEFF